MVRGREGEKEVWDIQTQSSDRHALSMTSAVCRLERESGT